jgi:hypothetical protein
MFAAALPENGFDRDSHHGKAPGGIVDSECVVYQAARIQRHQVTEGWPPQFIHSIGDCERVAFPSPSFLATCVG